MADIAQTLKRDPRHLGALMGMGMILEAREKREDALKIYQRVLEIAPHWRNAEAADKLKAALAGSELSTPPGAHPNLQVIVVRQGLCLNRCSSYFAALPEPPAA